MNIVAIAVISAGVVIVGAFVFAIISCSTPMSLEEQAEILRQNQLEREAYYREQKRKRQARKQAKAAAKAGKRRRKCDLHAGE